MLHPNQFQINEAWVAFQLNEAPLKTKADGDFNCVALMDAGSCFLLASAFVAVDMAEMPKVEARHLLKEARAHKQELPRSLFIPREYLADNLAREAERQNISVVRVPENELALLIGGARESFKGHFGAGRLQ